MGRSALSSSNAAGAARPDLICQAGLVLDHLTAVNLRRMGEHEGVSDVAIDDHLAQIMKLRDEGKIVGVR